MGTSTRQSSDISLRSQNKRDPVGSYQGCEAEVVIPLNNKKFCQRLWEALLLEKSKKFLTHRPALESLRDKNRNATEVIVRTKIATMVPIILPRSLALMSKPLSLVGGRVADMVTSKWN